jgi:hypothetical protein
VVGGIQGTKKERKRRLASHHVLCKIRGLARRAPPEVSLSGSPRGLEQALQSLEANRDLESSWSLTEVLIRLSTLTGERLGGGEAGEVRLA